VFCSQVVEVTLIESGHERSLEEGLRNLGTKDRPLKDEDLCYGDG
jgi:hypothetical protein